MGKITPEAPRADACAGFSDAAIVIPQGGTVATIVGLPPELGVYTGLWSRYSLAMVGAVQAALPRFGQTALPPSDTALSLEVALVWLL